MLLQAVFNSAHEYWQGTKFQSGVPQESWTHLKRLLHRRAEDAGEKLFKGRTARCMRIHADEVEHTETEDFIYPDRIRVSKVCFPIKHS